MAIDHRIREGLRLTDRELPPIDVDTALKEVTASARRTPRRRRLVVGLAAAAVAAVVAVAIVVPHLGVDGTPRPAGPTPTLTPRPTPLGLEPGSFVFAADASGGDALTKNVEHGRIETRPGQMDIYLGLGGRPVRAIIATRAHERCPAITPDRTRLAYLKDSTIVVVELDAAGNAGEPLLQVKLPAQGVYRPRLNVGPVCPQWSPDGLRLAYLTVPATSASPQAIPSELHAVTLDGKDQVLNSGAPDAMDFAWSPDSNEVAYAALSGVWRVSLDAGSPQRVWSAGGAIAVSWSVRNVLAFTVTTLVPVEGGEREDHTVHLIDLDSGRARKVGPIASMDARPAWSPDGSHLAFVGLGEPLGRIWVTDQAGAPTLKLTPPLVNGSELHCWDVAWSPDGQELVALAKAVGDALALVSFPLEGSSTTILTPWTWAFDWINLDDVTWARR